MELYDNKGGYLGTPRYGISSNGTNKEICDTVYRDVMEEVKDNLTQMKPQLVETIINEVNQRLELKYDNIIQKLEMRITELERKPQRMHQNFETRKGMQESTEKVTDNADRIDVSRLYGVFKYQGWIYYPNKEMADFLYKVKEDGSCNTQLTDYSVYSGFKVSNNCLHFQDRDLNDRQISLD